MEIRHFTQKLHVQIENTSIATVRDNYIAFDFFPTPHFSRFHLPLKAYLLPSSSKDAQVAPSPPKKTQILKT
jgi:hypothetical protein